MLGDDLEGCDGAGWREVQEGGDICTYIYMCIADSLSCTAGTNMTLKSNYTPIKKINKVPQTCGKQQESIFSQFCRLEVQSQSISRVGSF